ncbi:MAG: DUF2474 domain-containing protein [Thermodesulfobacteriota bacterium]
MKALTEKQRQWLWFALLWGAGLLGCLLIASAARLLIRWV